MKKYLVPWYAFFVFFGVLSIYKATLFLSSPEGTIVSSREAGLGYLLAFFLLVIAHIWRCVYKQEAEMIKDWNRTLDKLDKEKINEGKDSRE